MALVSDIIRQNKQIREVHELNATKQIDRVMDIARDRLTGIEDVSAVTKRFYETLTSEQKKLMDVRFVSLMPPLSNSISGNAEVVQPANFPARSADRDTR